MMKENIIEDESPQLKRPYQKCLLEGCEKDVSGKRLKSKFCCDGHKNVYNNKIKIKENEEIRKIHIALKKNRRIIKTLLAEKDEVSVTEKKLHEAGFNFDFSTHVIISKRKKRKFIFCYNYGYHNSGYGTFRLVKSFYGDEMPE